MRLGDWKLVVTHPRAKPGTFDNQKVELYRLTSDTSEKTDLSEEQPQRTAAMLGQLKTWYAETQATATPQLGGWSAK